MVTVTLENSSTLPRFGWCDVALPYDPDAPASWWATEANGPRKWLALRGRHVGTHSTMAHVLCDEMAAGEKAVMQLTPREGDAPPWIPMPGIGSHIAKPGVFTSGTSARNEPARTSLVVDETNPVRTALHAQYDRGGYHVDIWTYIYSLSSVALVEAQVLWSDMASDQWTAPAEALEIVWPEGCEVSSWAPGWARAEGWSAEGRKLRWRVPQGALQDAVVVPFRAILCFPVPDEPVAVDLDEASQRARLRTLVEREIAGAKGGPLLGICHEWDNRWLALKSIPRAAGAPLQREWPWFGMGGDIYRLVDSMGRTRLRPLESEWRAANAGTQHSFGLTQAGPAVTAHEPRYIAHLLWSVVGNEALRPMHHRELDGSALDLRKHPHLYTWDRLPHRSGNDFLGKPSSGRPPYQDTICGRSSHDEEHISALADECLALTGSHQVESWIHDILALDAASARVRFASMGRARATGRSLHWWANAATLVDGVPRALAHAAMGRVVEGVSRLWAGKRVLEEHPGDPARTWTPCHVDWNGDARVLPARPDPTVFPPYFTCYEEARAAVGLYAAAQVLEDPDQVRMARTLAYYISRTVVQCVYTDATGAPNIPYVIGLPDGDDLGLPIENTGDPNNWRLHLATHRGWLDWASGGLAVYLRLWEDFPQSPVDHDIAQKAQWALDWLDDHPPADWLTAHWRAWPRPIPATT